MSKRSRNPARYSPLKKVLLTKIQAPRPVREAWRRWLQRLPPGFWPVYAVLCQVAWAVVRVSIIASTVRTGYLCFANGNAFGGSWYITLAILMGAYVVVVYERKFREGFYAETTPRR